MPDPDRPSPPKLWKAGARSPLRWYMAMLPVIVTVNFAFAGFDVLLSVWTHRAFHAGAGGFGAMNAALSLGQLMGSLFAGPAARMSARTGLLAFGGLTSMSMLVFSLSRSMILSLPMMFVLGAAIAIINALGFAMMQRAIPEGVRGRAFGLIYTFGGMATPLASALAGVSLRVVPVTAGCGSPPLRLPRCPSVGGAWRPTGPRAARRRRRPKTPDGAQAVQTGPPT